MSKTVLTIVLDLDTKPAIQKIEELRQKIDELHQRLKVTSNQVKD